MSATDEVTTAGGATNGGATTGGPTTGGPTTGGPEAGGAAAEAAADAAGGAASGTGGAGLDPIVAAAPAGAIDPLAPRPDRGAPIGRRVLLGIGAAGAVGVLLGNPLQKTVSAAVSTLTHSNGGGLGALIPGAERFVLYTVTSGYPSIPPSRYRLSVGGLVERPLTLSLEQLKAMPRTELVKPFQCVTGWRVPDVHWVGVKLADVIDAAGARPGAAAVEFTSYDGTYTESLTMAEARRSDVIVAYEMLGAPITTGHGGPVRLYVAPMYGYKSIKWLRSISLVRHATPGFWEQNGYDVEAWIGRSNGRADAPVD